MDATVSVSPRTRFGDRYSRDLQDSFFVPEDGVPAYLSVAAVCASRKTLTSRVDLRLFAPPHTVSDRRPRNDRVPD